jgi:DNA-binding NtrC family response regulator
MISAKSIESLLWDVFLFNIDTMHMVYITIDNIVIKKGRCNTSGYLDCISIDPRYKSYGKQDGSNIIKEINLVIDYLEHSATLLIFDEDIRCIHLSSSPATWQIQVPNLNAYFIFPIESEMVKSKSKKINIYSKITNDILEENVNSINDLPEELLEQYFIKFCKKNKNEMAQTILENILKKPKQFLELLSFHKAFSSNEEILRKNSEECTLHLYRQLNIPDVNILGEMHEETLYKLGPILAFTMFFSLQKISSVLIGGCEDQIIFSKNEIKIMADFRKLNFIAKSKPMINVFKDIIRLSGNSRVLITGDSGTGKELVAMALHELSDVDGDLIPVNVAGLNSDAIEIKLFGARDGIYTGVKGHKGAIEQAKNGTLFLDEIGDISIDLQCKLLRVLEQRAISLPGDDGEIEVNFNLVVATHVDLEKAVKNKIIRLDFLTRISIAKIQLSPLSDRKADIMAISKFLFLRYLKVLYKKEFNDLIDVHENDFRYLKDLDWSVGNVRKLDGYLEFVSRTVWKLFPNIKDITHNYIQQIVENPKIESFDEGSFQILNQDEIRALTALVVVKQRKFINGIKTAAIEANEKKSDRFKRILHTAILKLGSTVEFDSKSLTDLILTLGETPDSEFYCQFLTYIDDRWEPIINESKKKSPKLYFGKQIPDEMIKSLKKSKQL